MTRTMRRTSIGKAIALLGVLALVALAAACGGSSSSDSSSGSGGAVKAGPLTVWLGGILATATPGTTTRKWWDQQVAAFEKKYPGTTIKTVLMNPDGNQQTAAYRASFGSHKGPDLAMMYPGGAATTFSSSLENLREVAPAVVNQYHAGELSYGCLNFDCTNNAPVVLVPYDWSGWVFAYNPQIFKKVGVTVPFKSWSDMVSAGEKLKAAGYTPFEMGQREGYFADAWLSAMETSYLTSADITNFLAGKLKLTDPLFVDPLTKWAALYKDGLVNQDACTVTALDSQNALISGKAASVASYEYSYIDKAMKNNIGLFVVPPVDGAPQAAHSGTAAQVGQGWTITKYTQNLPLATKFLAAITSAQAQTSAFQIAGTPPANPQASLANPPDATSAEASRQFLDFSLLSLDSVMPVQTQADYYKETASALCGQQSPEDAMSHVQSTFDQESAGG